MSKQQILSTAKIITLALIIALGIRSIAAFSNPPGAPPACPSGYPGCDAPLNAGPTAQSKAGALTLNASSSGQYPTGLYVFGQTVLDNSIASSSAVKIVDGSQHAGYVLTSDGNGNATWAAPTGGGASTGGIVATAGDLIVNSSPITTSWQTVNLGPSGLNYVPTNATAVVLRGETYVDPNCGNKSNIYLYARQNSSASPKVVSSTLVNNGINCYTVGGGNSGLTIVPLNSGGSIDYKLSILGNESALTNLYVVGYILSSGSTGTASTGKVYWEEDFDTNVGESQLYCNSVTGTGYCTTSAQNEVSMGCTDANILQDYVISSAKKSSEWTAIKHVGYCVGAPN